MEIKFKKGQRVWWNDPFRKESGYRTIISDVQKDHQETVRMLGEKHICDEGFLIVVTDDADTRSEVYAHELEPIYEGSHDDLVSRETDLRFDMQAFILQQIRRCGGRISLKFPQTDEEWEDFEFPVTTTLYGWHFNDDVDITDVYAESYHSTIYADGQVEGDIQKGYQIYPEHYFNVLWFITTVLNLNGHNKSSL